MPPNQKEHLLTEYDNYVKEKEADLNKKNNESALSTRFTQQPIIWLNTISIILFHIVSIISFFICVRQVYYLTIIWGFVVGIAAGFGVTAGAHRLWTHRAYKAKLPLQIILLVLYSVAGMNSLYDWVRDHRVHHRYSETDADPHNSKRGFFFSHVGWLMQKKHPDVIRKGAGVNMSDITDDPLLAFYNKHFQVFKILFCFILPVIPPLYFWNEYWLYALGSQVFVRYMCILNMTWSVNSFAHIWGQRPYDKRIRPAENIGVAIVALGEGWHNYHHVFPWDYKAAELGNYKFNFTTTLLDVFQKIGWVYDAKTPSAELVQNTINKYGDGSHIPEVPEEYANESKIYHQE
ncbi:acyl-CoA Delta-9 desaturase-like [Planococcus citri]|uniref:acyl-CoA Delta-9 desaturase-like n=1 Tax=Planococcus citri TaxID=170843 RepID=UPI0031F84BDB